MKKRIYYLDKIRILLCLLVIGQHVTIAYGGSGTWYYIEEVHNMVINSIFTIYNAVCQSFFMGLFFFISAYFTVPSYNKKGCKDFLKDRAVRLFVPLCIFYFILCPTTKYFVEKMYLKKSVSYCDYLINSILTMTNTGVGPLWFVEALILFSCAYVLYRKMRNNKIIKKIDFPERKCIFAFMIILGLVTFIVRIFFPSGQEFLGMKLGYFPQYIALFALGSIAYENKWLEQITEKTSSFYFRTAIGCFVLLIAVIGIAIIYGDTDFDKYLGGVSFKAFLYAMWEPFMCVGISLKLITYFRKKHDVPSKVWTGLALDTYPVFVIHAPISVFLECLLIGYGLNPFIKFIGVYIITCIICFAASHFVLRRVVLLRKIF